MAVRIVFFDLLLTLPMLKALFLFAVEMCIPSIRLYNNRPVSSITGQTSCRRDGHNFDLITIHVLLLYIAFFCCFGGYTVRDKCLIWQECALGPCVSEKPHYDYIVSSIVIVAKSFNINNEFTVHIKTHPGALTFERRLKGDLLN